MKIKQTIETENGSVELNATLSDKEVNFLIEYAINSLITQGYIYENLGKMIKEAEQAKATGVLQ